MKIYRFDAGLFASQVHSRMPVGSAVIQLGSAAGSYENPAGLHCGWLGFSLNPRSPAPLSNPAGLGTVDLIDFGWLTISRRALAHGLRRTTGRLRVPAD